jgi:hypothetical protein
MKKLILVLLILFIFPIALMASEKIVEVNSEGVMELQSGLKVKLAGIEMPEETIVLLTVLLKGKNCDIKEAKEIPRSLNAEDPQSVYMYIETADLLIQKEMPNKNAREKRMVNEFLLSLGSAKTDLSVPFKYQDQFIGVESQARETGQGVWSYEIPVNKTTSKLSE